MPGTVERPWGPLNLLRTDVIYLCGRGRSSGQRARQFRSQTTQAPAPLITPLPFHQPTLGKGGGTPFVPLLVYTTRNSKYIPNFITNNDPPSTDRPITARQVHTQYAHDLLFIRRIMCCILRNYLCCTKVTSVLYIWTRDIRVLVYMRVSV